jgi:hypothetical protein
MKKQLVVIGIIALLVSVGLSGCNQINTPSITEKTLPDGTKVTGKVTQIEIMNYQMVKKKVLSLHYTYNLSTSVHGLYDEEVPYDLNISDINYNLSKRKSICDSYFTKNYSITWEDNYTSFINVQERYNVDWFYADENVSSISVIGTAKNIGAESLISPVIIINFYNVQGTWLGSQTAHGNNIAPNHSWDFRVDYIRNDSKDVNYLSFEVNTNLIG